MGHSATGSSHIPSESQWGSLVESQIVISHQPPSSETTSRYLPGGHSPSELFFYKIGDLGGRHRTAEPLAGTQLLCTEPRVLNDLIKVAHL